MRETAFAMEQITVRVSEATLAELDAEAEEVATSRSEHIRETLASRHDHDEHDCVPRAEFEDLESEHERLQDDLERLRREKRQILDQREENKRLQRYVEHDREWHEAALLTRLKWYVRGKD